MSLLFAAALALSQPVLAQDAGAPDAAAQDATLDRAYQKEFAFLRAEKQSLQARVSEVQAERDQRLSASERELDRLQGQLLSLSRSADRAEDQLSAAEREGDRAVEGAEVLESTLSQAATTLGRPELVPAEGEAEESAAATEAQAEALAKLFAAAAQDLSAGGRVQVADGSFFGPDGASVSGQVVQLGQVARYGVGGTAAGNTVAGALVPAGDGALRIVDGLGADAAQALAGGTVPATVGLHTYESLEKRVDERKEKGLSDLMQAGGLVGWVIVVLGGIGLLLAGIRAVLLVRAGSGVESLSGKVTTLVMQGQLEQARTVARSSDSAAGRVLAALLDAVLSGPEAERGREYLEGVGAEALLREQPALERFQATLRVIAAVAPLLGLLGTVTGMIGTFELITEYGTGDPKMLSTGISQALVTTQLGLVVAIPMLLLGNVLKGRADQVLGALETGALAVLNSVDPDAPERDAPATIETPAERVGA